MTAGPPQRDPDHDGDPDPDLDSYPGVDPSWSRRVVTTDRAGVRHHWHVLDTCPTAGTRTPTMLCVHGNPTWSYLWRRFLTGAPPGWRVVAVDQLGMGWSERTSAPRTLPQRIDDLGDLTGALDLDGPVVVAAHDWGGPIGLGWALAHRQQLRGIVLTNTGVHQPPGEAPPPLIRLARTAALRRLGCITTPAFVRAATALSRPALPGPVRTAFAAPYRSAARRRAVGDFVADIPVEPDHPSRPALEAVADGLPTLREVPVLLLWGTRDPVFGERYLRDLLGRLPQADVHRYQTASHLVTEDAPHTADDAWRWITDQGRHEAPARSTTGGTAGRPIGAALAARAGDPATAVVELRNGPVHVSFGDLHQRVDRLAAGLAADGVRPGDRIALLVPPGADLIAAVYACWQVGAVIVVADAGLGLRALGRALRGAAPDHVIGITRGLALAKALGVPGRRIPVRPLFPAVRRALDAGPDLGQLAESSDGVLLDEPALRPVAEPAPDAEAAVLFTSGATGPPKGVVYRHDQLRSQLELLRAACRITADDRLVAAFAPFALYGPALGIGVALPDAGVTAPGTLTATALADAANAVEATVVFASPAALANVVATADSLSSDGRRALARIRLVMSAGAPVAVGLLRSVQRILPAAELHTPYGMTEALPVTDISLPGIEAAGPGNGVCVGQPLTRVEVTVSQLSADGAANGPLTDRPDVTGEICVRAPHVKDRYDRLWATERDSSRDRGWHRTGDVGHLDDAGRLWVEGRLVHVITTADGPVTPVGVEQRAVELDGVRAVAVVGVGPAGTQQVVVVVVPDGRRPRRPFGRVDVLAPRALVLAVRSVAGVPVAAVLNLAALPVDIRHASKIDRARVAQWAGRVLEGGRVARRTPRRSTA